MNKGIYKPNSLFPEGESLVLDASGERTLLESLEVRTRRAERRLAEVERELREKMDTLQNIKEHIINEARLEAKRIIEEAENQVKLRRSQWEDEARRLGYNAGYDAGYKEGREAGIRILRQVEEILDTAKKKYNQILTSVEEEIVELAILVAEKIIRQEIKQDKRIVVSTIKEALKRLRDKEEVTIRINMSEFEVVKGCRDEFLAQAKALRTITFKDDPSIEPGGCRIDTDFGWVDATISTQLEEIYNSFLQKAKEVSRSPVAESE